MDEEKIINEEQTEQIEDTKEDLTHHEEDNSVDFGQIAKDIAALREQVNEAFHAIDEHRQWMENIMKGTGAVLHDDGVAPADAVEDEVDEIAEADRRWYESQQDYIR